MIIQFTQRTAYKLRKSSEDKNCATCSRLNLKTVHGLKREKASGKKERYQLVYIHKKKHIEKDISIIL